jgi:glutamate/tyrosine decarboxylase-like PLP-dependent enzyme
VGTVVGVAVGGQVDGGSTIRQASMLASRESHLAWLKIAHQSGIGREALRLVETDGSGRMDAARLKSAIDKDRNSGHVPIMVVATAGTTWWCTVACAATSSRPNPLPPFF